MIKISICSGVIIQSKQIRGDFLARAKKEPKNKEWIDLCEYVKKEILQYDDNMKLPKHLILKLQGLKKGLHIANNNIESEEFLYNYLINIEKVTNKDVDSILKLSNYKFKDSQIDELTKVL